MSTRLPVWLQSKAKSGFTLIEILLVLMIIGILLVVAVNAYQSARFRGLIRYQTERVSEKIRSTRFEVLRGNTGEPECIGVYFKSGRTVEERRTVYKNGVCDVRSWKQTNSFDLQKPVEITVENDFLIYFVPPTGEMQFSPPFSTLPTIKTSIGNDATMVRQLSFNDITHTVHVSKP